MVSRWIDFQFETGRTYSLPDLPHNDRLCGNPRSARYPMRHLHSSFAVLALVLLLSSVFADTQAAAKSRRRYLTGLLAYQLYPITDAVIDGFTKTPIFCGFHFAARPAVGVA